MSAPIDPELMKLEQEQSGWKAELLRTNAGPPRPLLANARIALRKAPEWEGVLAYDKFTMATYAVRPPLWHAANGTWERQRWTDHHDALAADWLQHHDIAVTPAIVATAAETVARDRTFHPVADYLTGLLWDGHERLDTFAASMLGAEDTAYTRAVSRCMFVAAVARINSPGCKVDTVPILEGRQDAGKSTAAATLFAPWFTDDLADLGSKDAAMQLGGVWCVELAELSAMHRGEIERIKAFISRRIDRYRPAYGRRVIEAPRQNIFIGSTNEDAYLKDATGGRRFWPICCTRIDIDAIAANRDQLWAEAVALYNADEPWWITDKEAVQAAREVQADRYASDPWEPAIAAALRARSDTTTDDLLTTTLGIGRARQTPSDQQRVGRILKHLGWQRRRVGGRSDRTYRYFAPGALGVP